MPQIDYKFVAFLRATLAKMAGTKVLDPQVIDLEFWLSWQRRFYNIRAYDRTKHDFDVRDKATISDEDEDHGDGDGVEEDDEELFEDDATIHGQGEVH